MEKIICEVCGYEVEQVFDIDFEEVSEERKIISISIVSGITEVQELDSNIEILHDLELLDLLRLDHNCQAIVSIELFDEIKKEFGIK